MRNQLDEVFRRIDAINAEDPRMERVDGRDVPKELVYGRRMTAALAAFDPDASEALQIAARGQHVGRYRLPRDRFPMTRVGYLQWRTELYGVHAETLSEILRDTGYDGGTIERVAALVRKKNLKRDPEAQALEDVVCLVFLEDYLEAFAGEHDDDKVIEILRKTWRKMSEKGQRTAAALVLSGRANELVRRAVAD